MIGRTVRALNEVPAFGLARRAGLVTLGTGAAGAFSLCATLLAAFALGPAAYGAWAVIAGVQAFAISFLAFRTTDAVMAHLGRYRRLSRLRRFSPVIVASALQLELAVRLAISVGLILAAPLVGRGFDLGVPAVAPMVLLAVQGVLLGLDTVWLPVARAANRFGEIAVLTAAAALASLAATAAFWLTGALTVTTFALAGTLGALIAAIPKVLSLVRFMRAEGAAARRLLIPAQPWRIRALRPFFHTLIYGYWGSVFSTLVKRADVLILGGLAGPAEAGLYRFAKSLVTPLGLVSQALASASFMEISKAFGRLEVGPARAFVRQSAALTLPIAAAGGAILAAGPLVGAPALLGAYAGAYEILAVLYAGAAGALLLFWVSPAAIALRRVKLILVGNIVSGVVYLLVAPPATYAYGAVGAAIAVCMGWLLTPTLLVWGLRDSLVRRPQAQASATASPLAPQRVQMKK